MRSLAELAAGESGDDEKNEQSRKTAGEKGPVSTRLALLPGGHLAVSADFFDLPGGEVGGVPGSTGGVGLVVGWPVALAVGVVAGVVGAGVVLGVVGAALDPEESAEEDSRLGEFVPATSLSSADRFRTECASSVGGGASSPGSVTCPKALRAMDAALIASTASPPRIAKMTVLLREPESSVKTDVVSL